MTHDPTYEEETMALIEDAQRDRRKQEQRLASVQRAIEEIDQRIAAHQLTLDAYRTKYGLPKISAPSTMDASEAADYFGIGVKDMLLRWADKHAGAVVMKDACKFLAAAGLFPDARRAAGVLFSAAGRMPELERVARGVFQRKQEASDSLSPWDTASDDRSPKPYDLESAAARIAASAARGRETLTKPESSDLEDLPF